MKFVGVTACPAGVAHTYMAAKALEKEARERGHEIIIEKQGSLGIEDELEMDQIDEADAVILAVAVGIEGEERFEDKKVLEVSIGEALKDTKRIIDELENM